MSSLHHENILEDCFEVAMESFRINNQLTLQIYYKVQKIHHH